MCSCFEKVSEAEKLELLRLFNRRVLIAEKLQLE